MIYKGWTTLPLDEDSLAKYYQGDLKVTDFVNLKENEYCMITHNGNDLINEIWKKKNGKVVKVEFQTIGSNETSSKAKPRNPQQVMEFDLINDSSVPLKPITGTWGSFKTGALARAALDQLANHTFEKIIYIRNNIRTKDTEDLGALPGDTWDKMLPYVGPFIDAIGGDEWAIKDMVENKLIEVIPLGHLRGRNFEKSIIFVDESENLTVEHLQLIIARAAEKSQVWIDGDCRQRDRSIFEKSKGIETMIERLSGNKLFGYVHLEKSERSEVAALADLLKTDGQY